MTSEQSPRRSGKSRREAGKAKPARDRKPRGTLRTSSRRGGKRGGSRRRGPEERLHKYIANCGYCSRRRAELLIERGLVRVNGETVSGTGIIIDPTTDLVTINDEKIVPPEPLTVVLNKPAGYLTSTHDTHDRLTVMDLLPKKLIEAGVLPAGRLDFDTEGLLVLTNDGDLLHRVTHPSFGCVKEYRVRTSRPLTDNDRRRLERGIFLREFGKRTAQAMVEPERKMRDGTAICRIMISEGMKRQVRRMFKALGIDVIHLERVAIGEFRLENLNKGQWRHLEPDEINAIRRRRKDFRPSGKKPKPRPRQRGGGS